MRLWHKDLIDVLPRQQLLGQWRECCLIAKEIQTKGTPNHLLVNRVMNYPLNHFYTYGMAIYGEMTRRGYKPKLLNFKKRISEKDQNLVYKKHLFCGWHADSYLKQCLYNLKEKYDCGGITKEEWEKIERKFGYLL